MTETVMTLSLAAIFFFSEMACIFSANARSRASFGSEEASIHLVLVNPMMPRARAESIMHGAEWGRRLNDMLALDL